MRNLVEGAPMKMDYVNDLGNTQLATNKLSASGYIEVVVIHQDMLYSHSLFDFRPGRTSSAASLQKITLEQTKSYNYIILYFV